MSKFYLISVALLCLMCISCSQTEIDDIDNTSLLELESRSLSPITITYKTISGEWTSHSCDNLAVKYDNSSQASIIIYEGLNITQEYGSHIDVIPGSEFQLEINIDGSTVVSDDLTIDICENHLCYENSSQNFIGTALEFIVEDIASGL